MALMITTPTRPSVSQQSATQQRAQAAGDADGASRGEGTSASRATRPGVLSTAMNMQDDLSALVSSLQRLRRGGDASTAVGVEAWIDHVLDDSVHEKVSQLRSILTATMTPQQALRHVLLLFRDPSDAIAIMRALLADPEMEEVHELLESALDLLDQELQANGMQKQAKAGVASALSARRWSRTLRLDAQVLRTLYREFICNEGDAAGQYVELFDQVGFSRRMKVVDYLEQAVAADMYALDPSCSVIEFGRLLRRIRSLAELRSMDHVILIHCAADGVLTRIGLDPEALLRAVMDLIRGLCVVKGLMEGALASVRLKLDVPDRGRLLGAIRRAVNEIPATLWVDDAIRSAAIDDFDGLVSESVRREWNAPSARKRIRA